MSQAERFKRVANTASQCLFASLFLIVTVWLGPANAQSMYKYIDEDGNVVFSDKPPEDGITAEVRSLARGINTDNAVRVEAKQTESAIHIIAENDLYIPVQLTITLDVVENLIAPVSTPTLAVTVDARFSGIVAEFEIEDTFKNSALEFQGHWIVGDPKARHLPGFVYQLPYASASRYRVTQAYPTAITHVTPDSQYAVDFAMPIGTKIYAARGGVVFEVASSNFRSGLDLQKDGPAANIVRIVHTDSTHAVYAHLNLNSVRVRPGDRVTRGQYIADSGNTGFSTGPHLHFAVMRNADGQTVSVPVQFSGPSGSVVNPETGQMLVAP